MFGLSAAEIIIIGIIALVLFGNEKLPENLKKLATAASRVKGFLSNITFTWYEIKKDIKKNIEFEEEQKKLQNLITPFPILPQIQSETKDEIFTAKEAGMCPSVVQKTKETTQI